MHFALPGYRLNLMHCAWLSIDESREERGQALKCVNEVLALLIYSLSLNTNVMTPVTRTATPLSNVGWNRQPLAASNA